MARIDIQIRYVEPHGKARRYRQVVPPDVRESIGRKTWVETFKGRTSLAVIEREAGRLSEAQEALRAAKDQLGDVDSAIFSTKERI